MSKCEKCDYDLKQPGVIEIRYPVYFDGEFHDFYFCRGCFTVVDSKRADEIREWIKKEIEKDAGNH